MLPDVGILIVTYDRLDEITKTLYGLLKSLQYPREKLHFHLADDHSPNGYVTQVTERFPYLHWTNTVTDRKGWGCNVNTALKFLEAQYEYVYLNEDDYMPFAPLNLIDGVKLLQNLPDLGLIRYDGIAAHCGLCLWLNEFKNEDSRIDYLTIDKEKSSHLNVYSNRPHLRHKRFTQAMGYYAEGGKLGYTEEDFAHRVKDTPDKPQVAILGNGVERIFDHIGKSRQMTTEDVGK